MKNTKHKTIKRFEKANEVRKWAEEIDRLSNKVLDEHKLPIEVVVAVKALSNASLALCDDVQGYGRGK